MLMESAKQLASKLNRMDYCLPGVALAKTYTYPKGIIDTPEKIEGIFGTAASWVYTIFLVVAVIGLIYTAFIYLTAAGDMEKIKKGRISLTYSIVAIVIALLAGGMPALLQNILENK